MLAENTSMAKQEKLNTINFLDKPKTQKEYIELMRSNIS